MIEISGLSKTYSNSEKKAVNNISFQIPDGSIVGFIGHNGAGKTTTLKMITGISPMSSGTIKINGYDITTEDIEAKKQFGFVGDNPDLFLKLKGIEYLDFIGNIYGVETEKLKENIYRFASKFGMLDALSNPINSYSHGMRQKIMVIGALIHEPKVWILDEPLTGLDPQSAFYLKEEMRRHADEGNSVFFSTHVLEVAEKLCDFIIVINKGEIIFNGTLDVLKATHQDASLEDIFLGLTTHDKN